MANQEDYDAIVDLLARAAFVADGLLGMIDQETWRATGGDDMQGHYEGDYHAAQVADEIRQWRSLTEREKTGEQPDTSSSSTTSLPNGICSSRSVSDQEQFWLIRYEDADIPDEVFTDEVAARSRSNQVALSWNHTLFVEVERV